MKGIKHYITPLSSNESNGVAESLNHTIRTIVRSMLEDARLNVQTFNYQKLWSGYLALYASRT